MGVSFSRPGPLCEAVFLSPPRTPGQQFLLAAPTCGRAHDHEQASSAPPAARPPPANRSGLGDRYRTRVSPPKVGSKNHPKVGGGCFGIWSAKTRENRREIAKKGPKKLAKTCYPLCHADFGDRTETGNRRFWSKIDRNGRKWRMTRDTCYAMLELPGGKYA